MGSEWHIRGIGVIGMRFWWGEALEHPVVVAELILDVGLVTVTLPEKVTGGLTSALPVLFFLESFCFRALLASLISCLNSITSYLVNIFFCKGLPTPTFSLIIINERSEELF